MTALPTQVARNAVAAIARDFQHWEVSRYAGYPRMDDRGQPSVYVGIDMVAAHEEDDLNTGATYADARIVSMLSWRIADGDDWEKAADAAAELFGWWRAQVVHPDAQPTYPLDMVMVEEPDSRGYPLATRALWHVTASTILTLDELVSDDEIFGLPEIPEGIGRPDVWITDGEGGVLAGKEGDGRINARRGGV